MSLTRALCAREAGFGQTDLIIHLAQLELDKLYCGQWFFDHCSIDASYRRLRESVFRAPDAAHNCDIIIQVAAAGEVEKEEIQSVVLLAGRLFPSLNTKHASL